MTNKRRGRVPLGWSLLFLFVISLSSLAYPVHAAPSPDLTIDSVWLEDASQIGQPVSQVSPGQSFNIVVTIKNIGQDTASGYYLDVYYDSDYGRGGPDSIAPGEVQTWYVGPLTAQAGTHTTKWVVDPDNQIAELNEGNNEKDLTFTIGQQTSTATTTTSSTITSQTTTTGTSSLSSTSTSTGTTQTAVTTTTSTTTTSSTSTTTVPGVTVRLFSSNGNGLSGAVVQYYSGGWKSFGTTGSDGTARMALVPGTYTFQITYAGASKQKSQNVGTNPNVVFQTTLVTVKLVSSANVQLSGRAQYYAGGWKTFGGGTTTGTMELLRLTYTFQVSYAGASQQISQNTNTNPSVIFKTVQVHSDSGKCTSYYAGGWKTFTQDMQLLPGTYTFRFSDKTRDTSYTLVVGAVKHIH